VRTDGCERDMAKKKSKKKICSDRRNERERESGTQGPSERNKGVTVSKLILTLLNVSSPLCNMKNEHIIAARQTCLTNLFEFWKTLITRLAKLKT